MASRSRWIFALFFVSVWSVFAGGRTVKPALLPGYDPWPMQESVFEVVGEYRGEGGDSLWQAVETAAEAGAAPAGNRAELVLRAIAEAYPDRTGEVQFRDGDWTILVYGELFYHAEGRLLPESLRDKWKDYDPQPFYNYLPELPPWTTPTPEESARMKEQNARRSERQPNRSQHFFDALWRIRGRDESWARVKQIRFLGTPVMVHYSILEELSLVEERILAEAETNAVVKQWVSNIKSIDGWNLRNIAETQSRSYHAYGAAIDFLPKSLGGLQTYWLWTSQHTPEWWTVSYSARYHPPAEVVRAFESFGFVWGGKWRFFDTMHFEYRPEILVLSGIARTNPKELR